VLDALGKPVMDKRELGPVFRERLQILIGRAGVTRAAFAKSIGIDRSALTQLLSGHASRLPRVDTLWRISAVYSVSLDWLLGLSQDETLAAEIKPALEIAEAQGFDEETIVERWHKEAAGYKIRYVPAQIPDLLRTPDVIAYEYSGRAAPSPSWQLRNAEFRLDYNRRPDTDMEVCMPRQRLELLAAGKGHWAGLDVEVRRIQIDYMAKLVDELYPSFRLFLYDQRRTYSIPYTVFGPQRASIFVGEMYLVLNTIDHIRALSRHFDNLIRNAVVSANESAAFLRALKVT
jgi:transcriptional regulator with XRE-family HTH domain